MSANLIYKAFEQPATFTVSASELSGKVHVDRAIHTMETPYAVGESNASMRLALSVKPTSDLDMKTFHVWLRYKDSAGHYKWPNYIPAVTCPSGKWTRLSGDIAVPSGMTVDQIGIGVHQACTFDVLDFELWDGPDATKAVASHTPYATQGHLEAVYATQASLQVQSDRITSEVTERGKLAGRVGTLESTSGTHTSKLEQLATSIKSLVKGESTYTDPDGASATSGIYSLVTQTRDSVTALFGDYTKTEDLGDTDAVKDAKKAGTDAQATADSLATLIRADSTGITVGKSADGQTWSTGRTRMTDSAFQVLDKAGATIAQLAEDGVSFLAGLVRIVAGKATLPGNVKVDSITIDAGDGVAAMRGIISRLEATINGVTSSVSAGWEQDFGYGVTAIVGESTTAHLASDKAELRVGDNHMTMTQDGLTVNRLSFSKAPAWTVGRAVKDKCRAVYCVHGGTVFMSASTAGDWWSIDGWANVGPSLFSDVTHDQTTGVPPSLRPGERVYFPAFAYTGDLLNGYVDPDGSIWLHHSGSVANWSFSVSWPVGGA